MPDKPEKKATEPRDEPRPDTEPNVIGKKDSPGESSSHMGEKQEEKTGKPGAPRETFEE